MLPTVMPAGTKTLVLPSGGVGGGDDDEGDDEGDGGSDDDGDEDGKADGDEDGNGAASVNGRSMGTLTKLLPGPLTVSGWDHGRYPSALARNR